MVDDEPLEDGASYEAFASFGCAIPDSGDGVTWAYVVRTAAFTVE